MGKQQRICILDIGNSNVQIYCTGGGFPPDLKQIPTSQFSLDLIPRDLPAAAASVVPFWNEPLKQLGVFLIDRDTPMDLDLSLMDTSTLGLDRIANAAQLAADPEHLPALCIDCGTAIDAEIVNENRSFIGGVIMPGRLLMRRSLNLYTAQLPEIPFFQDLPDFPPNHTRGALRFGVDEVLLHGVEHLIDKTRQLFPGKELRIVLCGGDRSFFLQNLSTQAEDGGNDFTLRGIESIFRKNL